MDKQTREYCNKLIDRFGDNAKIAICYAFAAKNRYIVKTAMGYFPALCLTGPIASGKTGLSNATRQLGDNLIKIVETRNLEYDGKYRKLEDLLKAETVILETQDKFTEEIFSANTCMIILVMNSNGWTKEDAQKYREFLEYRRTYALAQCEKFYYDNVGVYYDNLVAETQNFRKIFDEAKSELKREVRKNYNEKFVGDITSWALIPAAYKFEMMREKQKETCPNFTYTDVMELCVKNIGHMLNRLK